MLFIQQAHSVHEETEAQELTHLLKCTQLVPGRTGIGMWVHTDSPCKAAQAHLGKADVRGALRSKFLMPSFYPRSHWWGDPSLWQMKPRRSLVTRKHSWMS